MTGCLIASLSVSLCVSLRLLFGDVFSMSLSFPNSGWIHKVNVLTEGVQGTMRFGALNTGAMWRDGLGACLPVFVCPLRTPVLIVL